VWWVLWCSQALVGDLTYAYQQYHLGVTPFPGWADPFYLAAYLPELLAMALLIQGRHPTTSTAQVLDSLIIALPVIAATVVFVVVPMLTDATWDPATLLAVAYPILDVIVLTALIRLAVGGGYRNRSLGLLTTSVSISLIADLLYNGLATQGLIEELPGWLQAFFTLGVILMAAAALSTDAATVRRPDTDRAGHPMSRGRLIGFGLGSVSLPVLIALGIGADSTTSVRVLATFAVVVNTLILWRALILLQVVAAQRQQLAAHARTDALTGLPNRRSWDFELDPAQRRHRCPGGAVRLVGRLQRQGSFVLHGRRQARDGVHPILEVAAVVVAPGDPVVPRHSTQSELDVRRSRSDGGQGVATDRPRRVAHGGELQQMRWLAPADLVGLVDRAPPTVHDLLEVGGPDAQVSSGSDDTGGQRDVRPPGRVVPTLRQEVEDVVDRAVDGDRGTREPHGTSVSSRSLLTLGG